MEALVGTAPDNLKLHIFGCAAYVHIQKNQARKVLIWASTGTYVGNKHGLHSIYLPENHTKHASFDEYTFPLSKHAGKHKIRKINQKPAADSQQETVDGSTKSLETVEEKFDERDYFEINDDESEDAYHPNQKIQEITQEKTRGYLQSTRRSPQWFRIKALSRSYNLNEQSIRKDVTGKDKDIWKDAMHSEVRALQLMSCWDVVKRPNDERVIHTTYFEKETWWERNTAQTRSVPRYMWKGEIKLSRGKFFCPNKSPHYKTNVMFIHPARVDI